VNVTAIKLASASERSSMNRDIGIPPVKRESGYAVGRDCDASRVERGTSRTGYRI
jgi:hypothetical protein